VSREASAGIERDPRPAWLREKSEKWQPRALASGALLPRCTVSLHCASHRRISDRCVCVTGVCLLGRASRGRASHGVHLMGMHLMGVRLMSVHLTGVCLISVYPRSMHLIGVLITA
jgi:hypothetical protein